MKKQTVGQRIKNGRIAKGWTVADLAHAAHVAPSSIRAWESGDAKSYTKTAQRLAAALGIHLSVLLYGEKQVKSWTKAAPVVAPELEPESTPDETPLGNIW